MALPDVVHGRVLGVGGVDEGGEAVLLVLGQHCPIEDLIRINQRRWKRTLAVEISYGLENLDIHFDLLLLFTEDSVPKLRERLDYMID